MGRTAAWRLAIITAIVAVVGLLLSVCLIAQKSPPPAAPPGPAQVAAPAVPPAAEDPIPVAADKSRKGHMRLAEQPKTYTQAPSAATSFSYSLRQQHNERTILPGVTYSPSQGVSVKTAGKDETVRITKDSTYPSTDYQVLWQKKY